MQQPDLIHMTRRRQRLGQNADGFVVWETVEEARSLPASQVALVLCDVWDEHWCRGAMERLDPLLPRMEDVVTAMRAAGALIVHAPSETMTFYGRTPARLRALNAAPVQPPDPLPHDDPELPIDNSDQGCDTPPSPFFHAWTCQHPAITIDQESERDVISDRGEEHYSLFQEHDIKTVVIMGVHTNMCILDRSFAIKALVRWGIDVVLVRDLTDTMYNPGRRPYVSHEEATQLVVGYIEKFWCPTVLSDDLLGAL